MAVDLRSHVLLRALFWGGVVVVLLYDNWDHFRRDTGMNNHHVHLAQALLRGHFELDPGLVADGKLHDLVERDGHLYCYAPPFPALLALPVVAVFGVAGTKPFLIKLALTALNMFVLRGIFRRLGVASTDSWWLCAGFFLGTAYWFSVIYQGVWWYSQVVAVTGLLLAVHESLGRGRGWLVGLFLGAAFLSRQLSIYSAPFLVALLWFRTQSGKPGWKLLNLAGFAATLAVAGGFYLWVNARCFGGPFVPGYSLVKVGSPTWKANIDHYGIVNLAYVPFNFMHMFFQGFHFDLSRDVLRMDLNGTSLTFASPWVFVALWAVWQRPLAATAWVCICLALTHQLLNYSNGWAQINAQRYTLDFLPVMLPLVAFGAMRVRPLIWKSAVAYSVVLNALALILLPRGWSLLTRYMEVALGPTASGT